MTVDLEIKCINKTDRYNAHERIAAVGGFYADGSKFHYPESLAITLIEEKDFHFHTYGGGKRAKVIIAKHEQKKYLKTENDGVQPNNLLALPECPKG